MYYSDLDIDSNRHMRGRLPPLPTLPGIRPQHEEIPPSQLDRGPLSVHEAIRVRTALSAGSGPEPSLVPLPFDEVTSMFDFVGVDVLEGADDIQWLCHGFLMQGQINSFIAQWKLGKTSLIADLLATGTNGGRQFLARSLKPIKAIIVTEEAGTMWKKRVRELGIDKNALLFVRFKAQTSLEGNSKGVSYRRLTRFDPDQWRRLCLECASVATQKRYNLVIIDALHSLWAVRRENEAGEVGVALAPLRWITDMGTTVLLVGHSGKGDAGHSKLGRGSSALEGEVDYGIEMRLPDGSNHTDTRRELSFFGRDTPLGDIIIDFDPETRKYSLVGEKRELRQQERQADRREDVLRYLLQAGEIKKTVLYENIAGRTADTTAAFDSLLAEGLVNVQKGRGNSQMCSITDEGREWLSLRQMEKKYANALGIGVPGLRNLTQT